MTATVTQLSLRWPNREQHPSVRTTDPDTCVEPSEVRMSSGRLKALAAHYLHSSGLTDFELAELTQVAQTSVGVRRKELERAGLVVATTDRRPSPSGSPSIVWRITDQGVAYVRALNELKGDR